VEVAANGINDAAVGREGERGNILVDVKERLVEVEALRTRGGKGTAASDRAEQRAEISEPAIAANGARAGHGVGCGAE
jgi:hypothetical protein